jgi:hypothetical protein
MFAYAHFQCIELDLVWNMYSVYNHKELVKVNKWMTNYYNKLYWELSELLSVFEVVFVAETVQFLEQNIV